MYTYLFVYPFSDCVKCSSVAAFESDELAVDRAVGIIHDDARENDSETYNGRVTVIRLMQQTETKQIYTVWVADVDYDLDSQERSPECQFCEAITVAGPITGTCYTG